MSGGLGSRPQRVKAGLSLADGYYNDQLSEEVAHLISTYTPRMPTAYWLPIADFVRACVADMVFTNSDRYARAYMMATSRLVLWATRTASLDLDRDEIFHRSTIERFLQTLPRDQHVTHTAGRAMLIRMSNALTGSAPSDFRPRTAVRGITAVYAEHEFARLSSWADGQSTPSRKRDADAMLAFGLGAGLKPAELGAARREDVTINDAGVSITVRDITPRTVPVHALWADRARMTFHRAEPGDYLAMPEVPRTTRHIDFAKHSRRTGEPAPNCTDLRTTWVVRAIDLLHPRAAAHFAGVKHSGGLQPFFDFTRDIDVEGSIALLRGAGDRW